MGVSYTSREVVKTALDQKETSRSNAEIDRAIEAASRTIDGGASIGGLLKRRFYPELRTMTFDWPQRYSRTWVLRLNQHELISVEAITSGGVTLQPGQYLLRPDDGPPFRRVEINLGSSAAWSSGSTHQRAISITGLFGYNDDEAPAGELAAAVVSTTATSIAVTDSAAIGVGHLIRVGDERMIVTGKNMLDSGQALGGELAALNSATLVPVASGAAFAAGETILVDSERMLIEDIAGNNLIVKRAWDGSTLAAHTISTDIYASRTLTVRRGILGTTAATHSSGAAIARHVVPGLVEDLCVALAINQELQEKSGYARTSGSGENAQEHTGRGLKEIRADALRSYGRSRRVGAV